MRPTLLLAALLLLPEAARADRSSTWWADSSSTASVSNSHARRGGLPQGEFEPLQQAGGDSHPRRGGLPGRAAPYQRAAQGELEPLQLAGGDTLQSRISNPKFSRLPASTQVISTQDNVTIRSHPDPVSSHILDTTLGKPAAGVVLTFSRLEGPQSNGRWTEISSRVTNQDGRASDFLSWEDFGVPAVYKIHFATGNYFREQQQDTFYPFVEVVFEVKDPSQHYHVPLLLNPFSFTTYRGS